MKPVSTKSRSQNPVFAQNQVQGSSQQHRGWQRFFLYRQGMPAAEEVPIAVSPSPIDALEDLVPSSTWVAGLWGPAWQRVEAGNPRGKIRPEFEDGADEVLMALDGEGGCYAVTLCPDDQPLNASRALDSIPVVQMRMVRDAWHHLEDSRDCNVCREGQERAESP